MLDERVSAAVKEAVEDAGQADVLANRILAWMEAVTEGREVLEDRDKVQERLDLLYSATSVDLDNEADGEKED